MPIFDHIGAVFYFAKHEMETKKKCVCRSSIGWLIDWLIDWLIG